MRRGTTQPAHIQIVFEEANKILSGLDSGSSEDESGQSTAEQVQATTVRRFLVLLGEAHTPGGVSTLFTGVKPSSTGIARNIT
jgi:hypothetical protein